MVYYIFSDMVWFASLGGVNDEIIYNHIGFHWRNIKDLYSLVKNFCKSIKSVIKFYLLSNKLKNIEH